MEQLMNKLQQLIYNEGERLIPYISHDEAELIRHRSSYAFFYNVISSDLQNPKFTKSDAVSIVDLGFGCGYGCALLSSLPNSSILGVDIGTECEIFAKQYYSRKNVDYLIDDLAHFIPEMTSYDYVVSRGVLEHVPNGLKLIDDIKFKRRVMIDVPFNEVPGNEHHVITGIKEEAFKHLKNYEIFYEDLEGNIYNTEPTNTRANMIMVVISDPSLPKVNTFFNFPLQAVKENNLEKLSQDIAQGREFYYDSPTKLLLAAELAIKETDVVLDIGCGIRPINYFKPKLHLLVEPCKEYVDILSYRSQGDKNTIIFQQNALESLNVLADCSVDSIFLLDVIEHIEKNEGLKIIQECERVARQQIIIFTPLGYMPQDVAHGEKDGWGLNGGNFQKHLSGWEPQDFNKNWSFHICKQFHFIDANDKPLEKSYGAFFAICNFERKSISVPNQLSESRIPILTALDAEKYYHNNMSLSAENNALRLNINELNKNWQNSYNSLLNSRSLKASRFVKKILSIF